MAETTQTTRRPAPARRSREWCMNATFRTSRLIGSGADQSSVQQAEVAEHFDASRRALRRDLAAIEQRR